LTRVGLALGLVLLSVGCGVADDSCHVDSDCPELYHCIDDTGVCERMQSPDGSVPDLAAFDDGTD
jgi:hypothetical protein